MKLGKFCYNGLRWVLVGCVALLVPLVSSAQTMEGVEGGVGMEPLGASGVESVLEGASGGVHLRLTPDVEKTPIVGKKMHRTPLLVPGRSTP